MTAKHNLSRTRVYRIYQAIKQRCTNPNNDHYARYGGRGIKVCDRWLTSFENFLADVGQPPSESHTIERKDNNGNYEPNNCEWATRKTQGQNRCNSQLITHDGRTQSITAWATEFGFKSPTTLYRRIVDQGMSFLDAVNKPVRKWTRRKSHGLSYGALHYRITVKGMSIEEAQTVRRSRMKPQN